MISRSEQLKKIKTSSHYDFLIIGGGASGLGAAVDAASRGYQTLLLESVDFAKGTSSRSTKLIHGGIRYLAQGNYRLVMRALRERGLLSKNAQHLFKNQKFIIPYYSWWYGWYYMLGLKIYNLLAGSLGIGSIKRLSQIEIISKLPILIRERLLGGIIYHDGLFDDARLAINLAQTAIKSGATVMNHFKVINLLKDTSGKLFGVLAQDTETGKNYKIKSKVILNATGVFTNDIMTMNGKIKNSLKIIPSQGIHLVLDAKFLKSKDALMIPKTIDDRVLFMIPWYNKLLVGTTDTPVKVPILEPKALDKEIEFILETAKSYLSIKPTKEDVLSVFAGLRPLFAYKNNQKDTKEISRDHKIIISNSGLISIVGGKWTTYRYMAEELVNKAIKFHGLTFKPCKTKNLNIYGNINKKSQTKSHLYIYGSAVENVLDILDQDISFNEKIHVNYDFKIGEIVWCIRNEMARTVEDILARRIRLLFIDARAALECAHTVAIVMAKELNKDSNWIQQQEQEFKEIAKKYIL